MLVHPSINGVRMAMCFEPSDIEGLKQFLCSLNADSVGELQEKGKISRKLAEEKYSKEVILQKFVEVV